MIASTAGPWQCRTVIANTWGSAGQCYRAWHGYYDTMIYYNLVWRDYDKLWEIPEFADVVEGLLYRYRYHRSHISHMRMDRMHSLVHQHLFTVFIMPSSGNTLPMCASSRISNYLVLSFPQWFLTVQQSTTLNTNWCGMATSRHMIKIYLISRWWACVPIKLGVQTLWRTCLLALLAIFKFVVDFWVVQVCSVSAS